jgi:hypothetical protein
MSAAAASAEAMSLFMSKFGNLSVGGGGGETGTGVEAGSASGEAAHFTHTILMVSQHAVTFVFALCALVRV